MNNENNWMTAMILTALEFLVLGLILTQVIGIKNELEADRGDMNYDGKIDFVDFSIFAMKVNQSE